MLPTSVTGLRRPAAADFDSTGLQDVAANLSSKG